MVCCVVGRGKKSSRPVLHQEVGEKNQDFYYTPSGCPRRGQRGELIHAVEYVCVYACWSMLECVCLERGTI